LDDAAKTKAQLISELDDLRQRLATSEAHEQLCFERTFSQRLIQSSLDGILAFDCECRYTIWNLGMERITGLGASEVLGKSAFDVFPFLKEIGEDAYFFAALQGHSVRAQDRAYTVPATGHAGFFEAYYSPLYAETGDIIGGLATIRDTTERKQAEKAIQQAQAELQRANDDLESRVQQRTIELSQTNARLLHELTQRERAEERLHFLSEASSVLASSLDYETTLASLGRIAVPRIADWCSINLLDEQGQLVRVAGKHVDPVKEKVLGDLRRRYTPGLMHAEPAQGFYTGRATLIPLVTEEHLARIAESAEQLQVYREMGFKSAMILPLHTGGRLLGIIILSSAESSRHYGPDDLTMAADLARRVSLAIDNARLYHEAQKAIQMRDEFLSIAAHELKTPVTSLLAYAQVLHRRMVREQTASERDQRSVQVLVEQTERLSRLIALLLDLSRIESGHLITERRQVDIGALARKTIEQLQSTLQADGSRHTLTYAGAREPLTVLGDDLRLEQVLQNLLQNAVKYSPDGGPIDVRVERRNEEVAIAIADHGMGIPAAAQAQLFQRFYRADNVDGRQIGGLGIGLYLVKEIVTHHGGRIEVASQEGQGSTFTVYLPLAETRKEIADTRPAGTYSGDGSGLPDGTHVPAQRLEQRRPVPH
jgi:PAS domain S-box-containing protein